MNDNENQAGPSSVEAEYLDIASRSAWAQVYQKINLDCQSYNYSYNEAIKPQNKPLNRYRDVNPYDHSRIKLERSERDYINANLVTMERANRRYILTQGPLAFTVGHFWLMVWEQDSRAILMLNKVVEKNEIKCHWYWPHGLGEENRIVMNDVKLILQQVSEEDCNYYSTRVFKIQDMLSEETREVIQFHYTTWPDFGVPSSPVAFLEFLKKVRSSGALDPDAGPPIVHCSAGIGRSGTFCLVDSCLVIIERDEVDSVDIQGILRELRRHRMGLIQTPDQLRFSYQAIIEGVKRLDPDYVEEMEREGLYAPVTASAGEEETPPPPPPRGESLSLPPLPPIPTSSSLGNLKLSVTQESSSDESPPTPPARDSVSTSVDDEDEGIPPVESQDSNNLRRRRNRDLAERVSNMKRKAREAERWQSLKRSLYKPFIITFGFILAGVAIYSYVKH